MWKFHRRALALAIAAAVGSMALPALADAAVQGRITDHGGQLLTGAQVSVPALQLSRTTGADGRFYFPRLPAGQYQLEVRYLGALTEQRVLQIEASNGDVQLGDIRLRASRPAAIEHIEVTGQSGAVSKALNRQRNATGIVTVASTDELGQLPDSNVSETLQRLTGLSVERDQGEGRFVRVRGLAPDYNAVTYNGTQLAAPEAGRRAVALDVIPADLLESVEVSKTLTPDMAAGSLGGTIEIKSLSAFDRSDDFYSLTAEGSDNGLRDQRSPKLSGVFSQIYDVNGDGNNLGLALAGSIANRKFGSDNVETGGNWDLDEGLEEFEQRAYQIERQRLGLALNLDYRGAGENEYYLRTLYSRFSDTEDRQALVAELAEPQWAAQSGEAELVRSLKQREETQTISALVLGTRQHSGAWQWNLEGGASKADEETPFNIAGADFSQDFDDGVGYDGGAVLSLRAPASAYLADAYALEEVEMGETYTKENEHNLKLDISREFIQQQGSLLVKAGVKHSQRQKLAEESVWLFEDFADVGVSALSLADYQGAAVRSGLGAIGPAISSQAIYRLIQGLTRDDFTDEVESAINDYRVDEDINAVYLQTQWERERWQLVTGVRYEHDARDALGTRYDASNDAFSTNQHSGSDGYWLPAVIGRYDLSEHSILRAAYSTGLVRPTFAQLAPAYLLEEDDGDFEASFGNPSLKALRSDNVDLGIEHYADGLGVVSAMLFYKDIDHFIYQADLAGRGEYTDFAKAQTWINGNSARLYGLELNAVHQFSGFGNWLDHLLLSANLTLTDSAADIEWADDGALQSRTIALPSQSDKTANLTLGYETSRWSLRLAANYKSAYLAEVGELSDSAYDVMADDHLQLDFSSKWTVTPGVQLYFNVVNLNDEPYYAYSGQPAYNFQYEQYGRTVVLGLQISQW